MTNGATDMAMTEKTLNFFAKKINIKKISFYNNEEMKKYVAKKKQNNKPPFFIKTKYSVSTKMYDNNPCYIIKPRKKYSDKKIIMIHGGAYILDFGFLNWVVVDELISKLDATVYVPIYPLAPEYNYKCTFEFMASFYKDLISTENPENISIIGDSAGAQIGLSFCQYLNELSLPQPSKLILLSPPFKNELSDQDKADMIELDKKDILLNSNIFNTVFVWWRKGTTGDDYLVSPAYGNFDKLCPVDIYYSDSEILFAQTERFKNINTNKNIRFHKETGVIHCFPYMPSKKGVKAFNEIIEILKS